MWWFYTKTGRTIVLIILIAIGVMVILDQLGVIQ